MIFDMCTSSTLALVRGEGLEGWANGGGVSRSLNVVYLEGVKEGEGVLVESEVVKAGKRLGELMPVFFLGMRGEGWVWDLRLRTYFFLQLTLGV